MIESKARPMKVGANKVLLDGVVVQVAETRYSPAGVPKTKLVINHESSQPEGKGYKVIECKVTVQIIGAEHAPILKNISLGDLVQVQGFLMRNGYREDQSWLKVQAFALTKLTKNASTDSGHLVNSEQNGTCKI